MSVTLYLLTCDLVGDRAGFDYRPLWQELYQSGAHRLMSRCWLVDSDASPQQVVARLQRLASPQDRLLAVRVDQPHAWYVNALSGTNQWLRERAMVA